MSSGESTGRIPLGEAELLNTELRPRDPSLSVLPLSGEKLDLGLMSSFGHVSCFLLVLEVPFDSPLVPSLWALDGVVMVSFHCALPWAEFSKATFLESTLPHSVLSMSGLWESGNDLSLT